MNPDRIRRGTTYSENNLIAACAAVRKGQKLREICRQYGVPKSTVLDRIKGRVKMDEKCRMGPDPVLSANIEDKIVTWLTTLAKCGFPLKKEELLDAVQKIVQDCNLKTPFKNGRPGQKWFSGFLKRHPELVMKAAESLDSSKAKITKENIKSWFHKLKIFLRKSECIDLLEDPSRIFNADETGFSLCPKSGKVLGLKGRNVYNVKKGNEKENLTVLITITADGRICPPVVVFPYVRPPKAVVDSMPENWILGKSQSGWMRSDVFFEFVANGLNNWVTEQNIPKPILLLVDGHRSHSSMELSRFCDENQIILYALPANTTHIIQPADVSVFRPMKEYWRQYVREWQSEQNKVVTKSEFCPILKKVLEHSSMHTNIKNGFRACGLYPFDPEAPDYSKCVQNTLENIHKDIDYGESVNYNTNIVPQDITSTEKVIKILKPDLQQVGIDVGVILDMIKNLKIGKAEQKTENSEMVEDEYTAEADNFRLDGFLKEVSDENIVEAEDSINFDEISDQATEGNQIIILENYLFQSSIDYQNPQPSTSNLQIWETKDAQETTEIDVGGTTKEMADKNIEEKPKYKTEVELAFRKHLRFPKPFEKKIKTNKVEFPSAISSKEWRKYYEDKSRQKEEKENLKKKRAYGKRKMEKEVDRNKRNKTALTTNTSNIETEKKTCTICEKHLESDAENENEKKIGCDICPRWFHFGCIKYNDLSYSDAQHQVFFCDFCDQS
ncbi:CENP-B homolog protein 2-like [Coccinella septempunctata]|uniref:CENP-B homolog protein 2-like n=1 Tax=Coccinella septempunctata TaxID=41139 RepID=UPI001D05F0C4|nr:CENP-B homolog protein 2-like [Coccinella septempunctata]